MKAQQPFSVQPLLPAARAESVDPTSKNKRGIINSVVRTVTTWFWTRRYRRHLRGLVEQRYATIVYGKLNESDFAQSFESLTAGILPHFQLDIRPDVSKLSGVVEGNIQEVAEVTVEESRDEIANRNKRTQRLQSGLADKEQQLFRLEGSSVEPPVENIKSLEALYKKQRTLDAIYATFGRLRAMAALAAGQAILALGLENILVTINLTAIFSGVAGMAQWMIVTLAIAITLTLVWLGHNLWSDNKDRRCLSAAALIVAIAALTVVRSGDMMSGTDGIAAGIQEHQLITWAVIALLGLAALVLALIGGEALARLKKLFTQASELRDREGENIAELESELAAARTHRVRQEQTRRNNQRQISLMQRDIQKTRAELQREIAKTRRLIHRRVTSTARSRLSGDISNMARQLAEWRYDNHPAPRPNENGADLKTLTTNTILFCVGLLGTGCRSSNVSSYHLLLDNSGSTAELNQEMQRNVLDAARAWIKNASPQDNFTLWWFSETGNHPANRRILTMPRLSVPAYAARQTFISDAVETLEEWFNEIPKGIRHTPLLETIFFIGLTQDEDNEWRLLILSDLQQDTPTWNIQTANADDDELLEAMKTICPIVKIPPGVVSLVTWPGIMAHGQNTIKQHQRHRKRFEIFFKQWAPKAIVSIKSL